MGTHLQGVLGWKIHDTCGISSSLSNDMAGNGMSKEWTRSIWWSHPNNKEDNMIFITQ